MSAAEFRFWQETPEFLGDERDDYRFARLEATIANFAGKTLAEGETVKPIDCMPYLQHKNKPTKGRWTRKQAAADISAFMARFRTPPPASEG